MSRLILSLDQGTTSSRAVLFNERGENIYASQHEFPQHYPKAGWVEHDPLEILESQLRAVMDCLHAAIDHNAEICAVGVTNQRETTILWDKATGKPVCPAIVWQCRRTAEFCKTLEPYKDMIREKTGLILDPYFSATKLRWMLDNVPGARERAEQGRLLFGTVDTWLIWNLTGGKVHATDVTNASRTMLFNIHTLEWDKELLELLEIPESLLPEVRPSSGDFGVTDAAFLSVKLPICGCAGDQQAALFGQCCFSVGDVKNTYGTGGFLLMNTGEKPIVSHHGLLTTVAWSVGGKVNYALEGSVFVSGAAIKWLRDELGIIKTAAETEDLAKSLPNNEGVYFVPAFVGMGTPHWNSEARGLIMGMTRDTGKAQLARAALEAIAYQTADVLHAMEADTQTLGEIKADGGAAQNGFLMQFQADILGRSIVRPSSVEATAKGAAFLAGIGCGLWKPEELSGLSGEHTVYKPLMKSEEREHYIAGWKDALRRTLAAAE